MKLTMKKNKGSASIYRRQDGFTLLELLIVVSLMTLLSFIVLASLDNARAKGRDVQMQSLFASLRARSEQYYSKYNTFGDVAGSDVCNSATDGFWSPIGTRTGLIHQIADVLSISDANIFLGAENNGGYDKISCHAKDDAWVVEAPFSGSTAIAPFMYCVDSLGHTTSKLTVLKGYTDYPGQGYSCNPDDSI